MERTLFNGRLKLATNDEGKIDIRIATESEGLVNITFSPVNAELLARALNDAVLDIRKQTES